MPHNILMPALSPTMTEGKLAKWVKKEGDKVKAGDVIAEIETDKATMEVEAVDEGILAKIVVPAGTDGVKVNSLIAMLLEEGEDASALKSAPAAEAPKTVTPANQPAAEATKPAPSMAVATPAQVKSSGRVFASPLAKRIAKEKNIDLSAVKGSGPHGRIVKADLDKVPAGVSAPKAAAASGGSFTPAASSVNAQALADAYGIPYTLTPNSGVRKVIARRLSESKQTVPHFYLTIDCELDALLTLRKQLNDSTEGLKISVNDFIIKATAVALQKFPAANVSWTDDNIVQYTRADVSVAVATPNGLITPIIVDAANKSLKVISSEMKDLGARAKEGKLKPQEFQGGTISVSNLGMFGISQFSAIINPPQAAILAVGAGQERVVAKNGQMAVANVMTVTASFDHRAIDGAVGAEYLQVFKKLIENPIGLLL
ncbi:MAG: pyruvate dehydrogenase complex dihydrolipoamide acetyltransferase [Alphaproteobacteria bacterium]|nr:pyruvate dehydrogenase complex dihydrolipoamide acetyltransferase [Alphaproteobacteria bacterium]